MLERSNRTESRDVSQLNAATVGHRRSSTMKFKDLPREITCLTLQWCKKRELLALRQLSKNLSKIVDDFVLLRVAPCCLRIRINDILYDGVRIVDRDFANKTLRCVFQPLFDMPKHIERTKRMLAAGIACLPAQTSGALPTPGHY